MEEEDKEAEKAEEKQEETVEAVADEELKEEEIEGLAEEEEPKETPSEEIEAELKEEVEKPAEEEEAKPPSKKKKAEEEEEIVEERIYTVPLGKAWIMPPNKRTPRAMRMLRSFMVKHMKLEARKEGEVEEGEEPKQLIISNEVNVKMWERGVEKPPRKIRVRAAKDKDGNVTVYLAEGD